MECHDLLGAVVRHVKSTRAVRGDAGGRIQNPDPELPQHRSQGVELHHPVVRGAYRVNIPRTVDQNILRQKGLRQVGVPEGSYVSAHRVVFRDTVILGVRHPNIALAVHPQVIGGMEGGR